MKQRTHRLAEEQKRNRCEKEAHTGKLSVKAPAGEQMIEWWSEVPAEPCVDGDWLGGSLAPPSLRSQSKVRDGVESVPTGFLGSFHGLRAVHTAHEPIAGRAVLPRRHIDRRPAARQRSPTRLMEDPAFHLPPGP
ncbi:MAG: hypothetical protein FJ398_18095 [Verrucomicrobia bacterium]|nr:hypothetical protein [Verrucomicrobiota bacterium]